MQVSQSCYRQIVHLARADQLSLVCGLSLKQEPAVLVAAVKLDAQSSFESLAAALPLNLSPAAVLYFSPDLLPNAEELAKRLQVSQVLQFHPAKLGFMVDGQKKEEVVLKSDPFVSYFLLGATLAGTKSRIRRPA
jgi:hypothetical protein